jgi:hypothetical protein
VKKASSLLSAFTVDFYLTMTVTSFEPQGVLKFTVYLPVRLLIEVMRKENEPYSLSVCEKTVMSGQSRVVGVILSEPLNWTVMTPVPPLFLIVIVSTLIENEQPLDSSCFLLGLVKDVSGVRSGVGAVRGALEALFSGEAVALASGDGAGDAAGVEGWLPACVAADAVSTEPAGWPVPASCAGVRFGFCAVASSALTLLALFADRVVESVVGISFVAACAFEAEVAVPSFASRPESEPLSLR